MSTLSYRISQALIVLFFIQNGIKTKDMGPSTFNNLKANG